MPQQNSIEPAQLNPEAAATGKIRKTFLYRGINLTIIDREEPYRNTMVPDTVVLAPNGGALPVSVGKHESLKSIMHQTWTLLDSTEKRGIDVINCMTKKISLENGRAVFQSAVKPEPTEKQIQYLRDKSIIEVSSIKDLRNGFSAYRPGDKVFSESAIGELYYYYLKQSEHLVFYVNLDEVRWDWNEYSSAHEYCICTAYRYEIEALSRVGLDLTAIKPQLRKGGELNKEQQQTVYNFLERNTVMIKHSLDGGLLVKSFNFHKF